MFDNFKAYHLRGKHGQSGPLEGSTTLRQTICEGNIDKVGHLRVRQFKAYHLRGKHGQSGPLEGSTILRHKIWEGNMDKVFHWRVRQF